MRGIGYFAFLASAFLFCFSVLLLIGSAVAVLECDVVEDGTGFILFRMLRNNNSHAELHNGSEDYPYDVNCSSSVSLNRTCSQAVVFNLYNTTNSHAELGNLSNFDHNVCMDAASENGTVYCNWSSSLPSGYDTCVASIASDTNAHVGDCTSDPFDLKAYCGIVYRPNVTSVECQYNSTEGYHCNITFDTSGNPGGTEYYINETTGNSGGDDQDWTTSTSVYVDTGLSEHTQYCYNVKARRVAGQETENSSLVCDSMSNVPPDKIILEYPTEGDEQFTNRTPRFNWTEGSDQEGDPLTYQIHISLNPDCSSPLIDESGLGNNYYDQETELDFAEYYWRVRAHDSYEYGEWSDIWNFTLVKRVEMNVVNGIIEFGMMTINEVNDTRDGDPEPFRIENIGNAESNVSVNATALWTSVAMDTEYYQFKANRTGGMESFDWDLSRTVWENISADRKQVLAIFNHTLGNNMAAMDLRIRVPQSESPEVKESTIEFYMEVS